VASSRYADERRRRRAGGRGLLFSLLVKRRFPKWQVSIFEQNPPDATFGLGVVFSLNALAFLERDTADLYRQLAPRLESWPMQRITHRGERVEIDGNGFKGNSSPISKKD
jgi:hypothetical protein